MCAKKLQEMVDATSYSEPIVLPQVFTSLALVEESARILHMDAMLAPYGCHTDWQHRGSTYALGNYSIGLQLRDPRDCNCPSFNVCIDRAGNISIDCTIREGSLLTTLETDMYAPNYQPRSFECDNDVHVYWEALRQDIVRFIESARKFTTWKGSDND